MFRTKIKDPKNRCEKICKKINILIVDDDIDSGVSLKDMIEIRGHNVALLDEGMKCINRCFENKFDIIFMDYHINDPSGNDMTGVEMIKLVRECFDIDTPVYAYTGDDTVTAIEDFRKNIMAGAFIKPVNVSLINEFFKIVEISFDDHDKLSRLARKNKNFIYLGKNKLFC